MTTTGHVHPKRYLAILFILIFAFFMSLVYASTASADTKDRIIRVGKQYLGTPHAQMNCSEFTRMVYGRATGTWMPADTNTQRFYGQKVRPKKRGDLVLFKEHGGAGAVTHVGIALRHGRILHSSNYFGEVVISDMQYIEGYRGARRIR